MNDIPEVLTVKDLAITLRVSLNTTYRLIRSGAIKTTRVGRQHRILKRSVLEYLQAQE